MPDGEKRGTEGRTNRLRKSALKIRFQFRFRPRTEWPTWLENRKLKVGVALAGDNRDCAPASGDRGRG